MKFSYHRLHVVFLFHSLKGTRCEVSKNFKIEFKVKEMFKETNCLAPPFPPLFLYSLQISGSKVKGLKGTVVNQVYLGFPANKNFGENSRKISLIFRKMFCKTLRK